MVNGIPKFRAGVFPIKSAKILNTWSVSGLRGTGSNDVVFENVFVPESYTFEFPNPKSAWQTGPGAGIPLMVQLGAVLAAVALGIARHAIDALKELAVSKVPLGTMASLRERSIAQLQLERRKEPCARRGLTSTQASPKSGSEANWANRSIKKRWPRRASHR